MGFSWAWLMRKQNGFKIGEWSIEPALDRISHAGKNISLQPQVMEVLVYLARHAGEVVSTEELTSNIWRGRVVTPSSIYVTLNQLRHAFGDDARDPRYLQTVPKRGYRLIAPVEGLELKEPRTAASQSPWLTTNRKSVLGLSLLAFVVVGIGVVIFRQEASGPIAETPRDGATLPQYSVAVLPFEDMSAGQDQGWFADGVSEEIINKLAQIPGLKVTGRTSSFAFRGAQDNFQHIGQTLGVAHLLEGSVRTNNDRVRITAQLLRAEDGFHVWSDNFEGIGDEIFSIQDEIAARIASTMLPNLNEDSGNPIDRVQPAYPNYNAYQLYLKALEQMHLNSRTSLISALDLLERSLAMNSDFVDAHVAIARVYEKLRFVAYYEEFPVDSFLKAATPHVERALELNPDHAGAHAVHGDVLLRQGKKQIDAYDRALELNPNLHHVHMQLGILKLEELVSWRETLPHLERALEIEPLDVEAALMLNLFMEEVPHRHTEAEEMLAHLAESNPNRADVKERQGGWQLFVEGRPSAAIPLFEEALLLEPDRIWSRIFLARSWYMIGEFETAEELQSQGLQWTAVFDPDREASLQEVKGNDDWGKTADFGRRLYLAYVLVMLRDYQAAIDMLAVDTGDMYRFTKTFVQQFGWHNDPSMSLAVAHWALGNQNEYVEWSEFARNAINIRTENGLLHNFRYSMAIARLNAMAGRHYDALLELEWLIRNGPLDIRELLYPAYDRMRDEPRFRALQSLQLERVNAERLELGLEPLPDYKTLTNHRDQPVG